MKMTSDHHVPEHPLPEEIQTMDRDDTVCKFCGISYLIHNEIKALEDRVKALDEQLSKYQDMEVKYAELQEQLKETDETQRQLQSTINTKNAL